MNVDINDLVMIIGTKEIELYALRAENQRLQIELAAAKKERQGQPTEEIVNHALGKERGQPGILERLQSWVRGDQ